MQGTVLDPTGAAVSGSSVTLRSKDTGAERTFITGSGGIYIFAALPPGSYDLTAEAKSFAKTTSSITVTAARHADGKPESADRDASEHCHGRSSFCVRFQYDRLATGG